MNTPDTQARAARILERWLEPRLFACLLVVLSGALCLWYLPYGLPTPDAGAALVHAAKIDNGAVFYRDIDAYPFPAASYLLAAVMRVFGQRLDVARTVAAVVYTAILLAGYGITLAAAGRGAAALCGLCLLSLKFFAYPAFHDYLYPEVALAFALWSVFVFQRFRGSGRRSLLLAAGLLAGMTVLSKQNLGIYLVASMGALAVMIGPHRRAGGRRVLADIVRDVAAFASGAAVPIVVAGLYFQTHGLLGRMLYSGLVRPFSGYMPTSSLSFTVPLQWWNFGELGGQPGFAYSIGPLFGMLQMEKLPLHSWYPVFWMIEELLVRLLYTAIPLVFAVAAISAIRSRHRRPQSESMACLIALMLAVVGSAFPRADYYHIASIYPAVLILAFTAGSHLIEHARRPRLASAARLAAVTTTAAVVASSLLMTAWYFRGMTYEAGNDRGRMRIPPEIAWVDDVVRYLDANLERGDNLFVYGHEAYYYFLSDHYASWPFVQLYPGMTGDDDGRLLAATLARKPPRIIVRGLLAGWPGLANVDSYAGELKKFVDGGYEASGRPFSDGDGPDAPAPPAWLFAVMEPRRAH